MIQLPYERPREKLINRGVKHLTTAELTQIIIGSGTVKVSGARLARVVTQHIKDGRVEYLQLSSIDGLGPVKACQVVAALELGRRLVPGPEASALGGSVVLVNGYMGLSAVQFNEGIEAMRSKGAQPIMCYWLDGSGAVLDHKSYQVSTKEHYVILARRIVADIIAVSARSFSIFVVSKNGTLTPNTFEMGLIKTLSDMSTYFFVNFNDACAIGKSSHAFWKKEVE